MTLCVLVYAVKYHYETSDVSIYAHDLYHTDTWLIKWKIMEKEETIRQKNKKDIRTIEGSMRKANAEMLTYDTNMEPIMDAVWAKVKIYASFLQLVALLPIIVGKSLFPKFQTLTAYLAIINLDFPLVFSLQCQWNYDFVDILLAITIFPIIVCGSLSILHNFYVNMSTAPLHVRTQQQNRCLVTFFVWSFLTLPAATSAIFQMLTPCQHATSGNDDTTLPSFLHADNAISCDSERYRVGVVWAWIMLVAYCLILPGIYTYLLYQDGHHIKTRYNTIYSLDEFKTSVLTNADGNAVVNNAATHARELSLQPLKFLYAAYQPQYFYWEVIETYRRILLAGVLIVCHHGRTLQLVVACVVCVASILLYSLCDPYQSATATLSSKLTLWQLFGLFFVLLVASDESFSVTRQRGMDWAMIGIIITAVVVEAVVYYLPSRLYSKKGQYVSVHTEVQMSDKEGYEREYDDDYEMSFPGDSPPPLLLSRSGSFKSIGREASFSSLQTPPRLQQTEQQTQQRQDDVPDSLQHWTMQRSQSSLSRQSSYQHFPSDNDNQANTPFLGTRQPSAHLNARQESKECPTSKVSQRHSQYFLRGPALEHAFQQEIQKYTPITVQPEMTDTAACSELDTPSFGATAATKGNSKGEILAGAGGTAHSPHEQNESTGQESGGLSVVDDRQRKFACTTPITRKHRDTPPSGLDVSLPTAMDQDIDVDVDAQCTTTPVLRMHATPLDIGTERGLSSVPGMNRSRPVSVRQESRERELMKQKEMMMQERERLLRANEQMK
jgi:hypothetical protein